MSENRYNVEEYINLLSTHFNMDSIRKLKINEDLTYHIIQHLKGMFCVFINFNPQRINFKTVEEAEAYVKGLIDGGNK